MPVPSTISDISDNASINSPAGTDQIAGTLDDYLRAIQAILKKQFITGGSIAASATLPVPAAGAFLEVTGSATIQQIANSFDGRCVILRFAAGSTLQHSSALIMPGGASITTQANDAGVFVQTGAGTWTCAAFSRSLNSDMVGGYHAGNASGQVAVSNGTVCTNLNADLLDGQQGAWYADIAARLGFTPVQQGTGVGQTANAIKIGWSAGGKLKATVDSGDLGNIAFESWVTSHVTAAISSKADTSGTYSGLNVGYATNAGNADTVDGWHRDDLRWWPNINGKPAGADIPFNWAGQAGQPAWLWGANDAGNTYVWNPANFNVAYANSAGYATSAGSASSATTATTAAKLSSSPGAAPHYACRAWVDFSGVGNIGDAMTIYGAGNVSSVVKNGNGDYTVTFSTPMASAQYGTSITQQADQGNTGSAVNVTCSLYRSASAKSAGSVRVITAAGGSNNNPTIVSVAVFC